MSILSKALLIILKSGITIRLGRGGGGWSSLSWLSGYSFVDSMTDRTVLTAGGGDGAFPPPPAPPPPPFPPPPSPPTPTPLPLLGEKLMVAVSLVVSLLIS